MRETETPEHAVKSKYEAAGMKNSRWIGLATVYLRLALAAGFLSAVADRFGLWGPVGTPLVDWGNLQNFEAYVRRLNPWFPASWGSGIGWASTACEIVFGVALALGYHTRLASVLSGLLTLAFAIGMIFGIGGKAPLDYSVFAASAASFLLAGAVAYPFSIDSRHRRPSSSTT